tara:strand:- start:2941 stop:3825 length:885 start_codon:yes stop_codon:yes gene_type:complete
MKIIILGSNGQLGKIISNLLLKKKKYKIINISRKSFDLIDNCKIETHISKLNSNIIINCAAFTDVDKAENEKEKCINTNTYLLEYLSNICNKNNSILFHFSTDYVFDGKKGNYKETDKTLPINYYGYTKKLGENIIKKKLKKFIIIRTSWLYSNSKNNFFSKIINKIINKEKIQVVDDQFGFPTSAYDLANVVVNLIEKINNKVKFKYGIYHYSNHADKPISWYDFAIKINYYFSKYNNKFSEIINISSNNLNVVAKRPINSSLNIDKICNTFNISKKKWDLELKKIIKTKLNL